MTVLFLTIPSKCVISVYLKGFYEVLLGYRTKSSFNKTLLNPGICLHSLPFKAVRYRQNLEIVLNNYFSMDLEICFSFCGCKDYP